MVFFIAGNEWGKTTQLNIIDDFIKENKFFFSQLVYEKTETKVEIHFHGSHKLELFIDDIALLKKGSLIQNKEGLEFQQNHTLRIENYSEVFIGVEADDFAGLYNYLENIDLSFKIGNHPIEFSRVSPICCLLLEPYFSSKHYDLGDKGLSEYFYTLKILLNNCGFELA